MPFYGLWLLGNMAKTLAVDTVAIIALGPVYLILTAIAATERRR